MGNQQRKPPHDYNAAQREADVLRYRAEGKEFDEIARLTGYENRSGAYKAYRRALARIPEEVASEERRSSLMRLNSAVNALQAQISKGNTFAIDQLVKLEDRRAKLLGLDAKGEVLVSSQVLIREYSIDVEQV